MKKQVIIGLTALLMGCATQYNTPKINTPEAKMELARCLVREQATMYGAAWCGYCKTEKEQFGPAWKIMQQNYVECADEANLDRCMEVAINGRSSYPAWKFKDGTVIRGYTPNFLEVLAKQSGCD